ncbi:MAG TPA: dihydrofolate reductase family protein [Egibacteraceae bacterium]
MRALVYLVNATLDGYIAGPKGEIDFFPLPEDLLAALVAEYPETIPTHLRAQVGAADAPNRRFDTVVMGRGTYQPALDVGVTSPYAHLRQHVVSTTLPDVDAPEVEVVRDDPLGLVRRLKQEDGLDIWLCGGGTLAGAVLSEIDRLVVKRSPVLAGDGVPMIAGGFSPASFALRDTRTFSNGTTMSTFERVSA